MLFATSSSSLAQDSHGTPIELVRVRQPIVVDGVKNDEGWRDAPVLPAVMYTPIFKGQPTQRTEMRVVYDEANLYIGGWFYDSDPKGIRINSLDRDRWNGDDTLAIYIDAFNDNQNAKWFGITPAGMRFDALVSDDGNTLNDNWDGFWTGSTTVTSDGWFVEVRIPFSTLGFQADADGKVVMGLTLTRLVSRLGERVTFPAIDPKFPFRRPSMAQRVQLRGVTARKPFYFTPYALAGIKDAAASPRNTTREIGADVRYPFTSDLTLGLTLNTDFAQVEADDQQVALDRFPLFYPERRRFFQEGASLFDFVTANGTRLFHSRRIGLTPALQPVRILDHAGAAEDPDGLQRGGQSNPPRVEEPRAARQDPRRRPRGRPCRGVGRRPARRADRRGREPPRRELQRHTPAASSAQSVLHCRSDGDHVFRRWALQHRPWRRHVASSEGGRLRRPQTGVGVRRAGARGRGPGEPHHLRCEVGTTDGSWVGVQLAVRARGSGLPSRARIHAA